MVNGKLELISSGKCQRHDLRGVHVEHTLRKDCRSSAEEEMIDIMNTYPIGHFDRSDPSCLLSSQPMLILPQTTAKAR
jgi:hypothetical protein